MRTDVPVHTFSFRGEKKGSGKFLAAIARKPKARKFLATLSKANLYAIGYRLTTAKRPETRQKRFDQILAMLENGEKFH